mmetsp:Transcript_114720/g.171578  ORF Transcript_114720/g.171578 Transcript_114720/m.171578 type:complete len:522 (+) Transcript_114720:166-1731(+)
MLKWGVLPLLFATALPSIGRGVVLANEDETPSLSFPELEASWQAEFDRYDDDHNNNVYNDNDVSLENSCASIDDCNDCAATYSCHWCDDGACHARGSRYGCTWGKSCSSDDVKPKENSTCASQTTCSDCALSSSFCHWCELDNACHVKGSPYGCITGVDCYSNDRCRRSDAEKLPFSVSQIPMKRLVWVLAVAIVLILSCSCCHFCVVGNVKGAYDDLATIAMTAIPRASIIGGDETEPEGQTEPLIGEQRPAGDEAAAPEGEVPNDEEANRPVPDGEQLAPEQNREQPHEEGTGATSNYVLMDEDAQNQELSPLIPTSTSSVMEEPRHMKSLYRICTFCYYFAVTVVLLLVAVLIILYPVRPVYNVCNDAVAWKKIFHKIAAFKLDLGFEILISLSNPNRLQVALDNATGSFTFEGDPVGTFSIPPDDIDAMAITDVMLITHVTPSKMQAFRMGEAYANGNLLLEAEFDATIRVPFLMNLTRTVHVDGIQVYVNELSDRSLCACPTWDDHKNGTDYFGLF